jgi:hypothetical protein
MRYVIGFIVGVAITVGGAAAYDNMRAGVSDPLVNWRTANNLQRDTVDYVRERVEGLAKQLGII